MTRLDLAHEHPRFTALRSLAEDTPPAGLRGPDAAFPPQEEAAELLTNVADDPAEPLRCHKETPKTPGDVKVARKVMTRADVFPETVFGERVDAPNANVCVELSPSRSRRAARQRRLIKRRRPPAAASRGLSLSSRATPAWVRANSFCLFLFFCYFNVSPRSGGGGLHSGAAFIAKGIVGALSPPACVSNPCFSPRERSGTPTLNF